MKQFRVLTMINPVSYLRIGGVARFAKENGWLLTIHDRLYGVQPSTDYDGVLVTLRQSGNEEEYVRRMRRRSIPVVDLTIERPEIRLPRVISDHRAIGRLAGQHFEERGFSNVAWFSVAWTHVHDLRYRGLAESSRRPPDRIVSDDERETLKRILALPKPLAVLTYDEADAARLLTICLRAGIAIPDDVAILAIGDDPLFVGNQAVPLSSVGLNPSRAGYAAAALLQRLMTTKTSRTQTLLIKPTGVIVRRSTDTLANDDPLVRRSLLYIRDNLSRPFGAEQIANALGVSRSILDKTCAAKLGHSLGHEILQRRMQEAQRRLKRTDDQVAEIARATGFCSSAYFVKRFRELYGQTPFRYRTSSQRQETARTSKSI